jgi:hypothetical protein
LAVRAEVRDGPQGAVRDIRLDRCPIIRGRALDGETGRPIPGASVVYRPSRANTAHNQEYLYDNAVLTDPEGRFALTVLSGPGYLLVEVPDRSYLRSADVGRLRVNEPFGSAPGRPSGLTEIMAPPAGTPEEIVIRMKRGRTVTLHVVGPNGEKLAWVEADWEGNYTMHDQASHQPRRFPDGEVIVEGLDSGASTRVFLVHQRAHLAAVFTVGPKTEAGPIEVRLAPIATVTGQLVTQNGKPTAGFLELFSRFPPEAVEFTKECMESDDLLLARFCVGVEQQRISRHTDGRFTVKNLTPGVPLGLSLARPHWEGAVLGYQPVRVMTLSPLAPGEQRDLGRLIVFEPNLADAQQSLLRFLARLGVVPDLSELGKDRPPKVHVLPGSRAEKAGIRSGDRITALKGRAVKRIDDVLLLWSQLDLAGGLRLSLLREGKQVEVKLPDDVLRD